MPHVHVDELRDAAEARLRESGVRAEDARIIVEHFLTATLWGRTSHGISLRFGYVLRQVADGAGGPVPRIVDDEGHRFVMDAQHGFGYVAAYRTAEALIERARRHGVASAAVRNAGHTGMIGHYADMVARAGVVAVMFANCSPLMAPWGGRRALLGTNPITFAFPAQPDPILVDMATSAISYGELSERADAGETLPGGRALDADGEPTCDPAEALEGALLPFGEHRGGALAVAVQLLAGALTGSPSVPDPGAGYGLLMVGLERGVFAGAQHYDRAVAEFIERYLAVPARPGMEVRLPGSRRYRSRRAAGEEIEISDELAELLGLNNDGERT